jgi:Fe-S cluster assembly protein SufD
MEVIKRVVSAVRRSESPAQQFPFLEAMIRSSSDVINKRRQKAFEVFQSLSIPTTRDEAWRRTDLRKLHPEIFQIPAVSDQTVKHHAIRGFHKNQAGYLHLEDNQPRGHLDQGLVSQGVILTDLRTAEQNYPLLVEKTLGSVISPEEGKFAALATAFSQNGIFVYIPKNIQVHEPLTGIIRMNGDHNAFVSHTIIYLDEGASLDFILELESPVIKNGQAFHSGLVEIIVSPAASLKFVEIQALGDHFWHIAHQRARVERDANIEWTNASFGGRLVKTFATLDLSAPGGSGRMSGIFLPGGNQHMDLDTQQNHLADHTTSDLLYKGAGLGKSRSVWQGMIYVAPGSVKSNGYQANRNLVLSKQARIDAIPGLQILADDVRCSHGATVGKTDKEQVFYILSRGIPQKEAERVLVQGFFDPLLQTIPNKSLRSQLAGRIMKKIDNETK